MSRWIAVPLADLDANKKIATTARGAIADTEAEAKALCGQPCEAWPLDGKPPVFTSQGETK